MKSKEELEKIVYEFTKDIGKYNLTYPELMIITSWIQTEISFRVKNQTYEYAQTDNTLKEDKEVKK